MSAWLSATPAVSLLVCVGAFALGQWLADRSRSPLMNPVVFAVALCLLYLKLGRLDYETFSRQTNPISVWLSPAVVALALPLHERTALLKRHAFPIAIGVVLGATLGVGVGWLAGRWLDAPVSFGLALSTRQATAPIAMALAERAGGAPVLSGAVAILTGMAGATLGIGVLNWLKVKNPLARGLAMGLVSHGIGTARILSESDEAGAASGLGMCLSGIVTALIWSVVSGR